MKTFMFLGLAALALAGCSDTIVMHGSNGQKDVCEYSLDVSLAASMRRERPADGMTMANGPAWWTFYR